MSEGRQSDYRDRITDEAAEWFARLQDSEVSHENRTAFAEWLSASPEHVREYLALTALQTDISELPEIQTVEDLVRLAGSSVDDNVIPLKMAAPGASGLSHLHAVPDRQSPKDHSGTPGTGTLRRALAAAIALVAFGCMWLLWPDANSATYTTGIGEQKSFTLPDGSVVTLNAVSKLQVKYTEHHRDIQLQSGEALFTVAKNPQRPFRVLADGNVIQAVGTRFNVRRRREDITVTVIEGKVAVAAALTATVSAPDLESDPHLPSSKPFSPSDGEGREVRNDWIPVSAGQRAHIGDKQAAVTVKAVDPVVDTAWRERRLIFEARSLSDVVAEFNLYNESPIEIRDPRLSAIEVSGSFYANDPQSFALFLEEAKLARQSSERNKIVLVAVGGN